MRARNRPSKLEIDPSFKVGYSRDAGVRVRSHNLSRLRARAFPAAAWCCRSRWEAERSRPCADAGTMGPRYSPIAEAMLLLVLVRLAEPRLLAARNRTSVQTAQALRPLRRLPHRAFAKDHRE